MPSSEDFEPTFDNFDLQPPVAPAPQDLQDPWGFGKSPPKPKKKKGKKNAAKQNRVEEGEESSYPKSITPSPPTEHGVKVPASTPPPPRAPSPRLVNIDDDTTAVEDVEPSPALKPVRASPSLSPMVRSPRPAVARPVPPTSPPSRPVSLHGAPQRDRNNSLASYRPAPSIAQPSQQRRESFASTRPRFVEPPPPHMPQAHFFGLPDFGLMGLGQKQETGKPAGSDGYCCRLDSFADAGDDPSAKKAKEALLVGSEGGLEVFRLLQNKLEVVGRLEGLRGAVLGAKILPHVERLDEMQALRPLVAVIVHGPALEDRRDSGPEGEDYTDTEAAGHFQTSVEVYSLQGQIHVATLYSSTPVPIEQPTLGQVSSLPDPVGDLTVDAKGQYITISSGKSGEIFVFTQAARDNLIDTRFRCIGKFWTVLQRPLTTTPSRPTSAADATAAPEVREEPRTPLYSLSQRWLAIVPPFSSSNISIQGLPLLSDVNPSPPGITTHAAPPQSPVSCEVVGTDVEGAWSRLGRQAAQGLVKYSQKGIEMGLQGWKELTHPSPPGGKANHDRSSSRDELFPPTKAPTEDPGRLAKEPALVSIVDLETLLHWEEQRPKYLWPPLATFAIVDGCNFLSLSSTGTRLLTSSRKGEVSTVWDLQQVAHGIPKGPSTIDEDLESTSPCIRQLQRIARNSPSTVLECAWSRDDDALALLTAHGTVHLHEVVTRPSRKRKRASSAAAQVVEKADATVSLSSGMSPPSANQGFLGSIKSGWQTVSTQVNSIRTTNAASAFGLPTTFAGYREAAAAAGNAGSRAVARSLSQGYTAAKGGASDYWHADDNKIRHTKELQEPFASKSIRWVKRNNTTSVVIACGGSVHVHPVQRVTRRKGDAIVSGLKNEKYAHKAFPLPPITTCTEVAVNKLDSCTGQGPHGFWSLRHSTPPTAKNERRPSLRLTGGLHRQGNDVETNPPYCPFHVDARVNIFAFEDPTTNSQYGLSVAQAEFQIQGHDLEDEEPWLFGQSLPPSNKINERVSEDTHETALDLANDDDEEEEDFASQMESKLTIQTPTRKNQGGEQIRINTRRRQGKGKGAKKATTADDDLDAFLEDDEGMM
ncbi:hypothetical protein PRZ48_001278 [Zasmidium cellare]|uniref:Uncharacterized protein n=1 Tax=Zasmidium cellare TaxID=395010 RepID=A0ABR0F263_ZASCE|nr:hypothetical protein PRZ48_001278 [Zasmidium cellare]